MTLTSCTPTVALAPARLDRCKDEGSSHICVRAQRQVPETKPDLESVCGEHEAPLRPSILGDRRGDRTRNLAVEATATHPFTAILLEHDGP